MRFPDRLTIRRRTASDEYGNPGQGVLGLPQTLQGFLPNAEKVLLPASTQISPGDELALDGRRFAVVEVLPARSPSRVVLVVATLKEVPA